MSARTPFSLVMAAGSLLCLCFAGTGCVSTNYGDIALDAVRPSIRYSSNGVFIGDKIVNPNKVPVILEDYGVPHDRVIHILVDEDSVRDLKPARAFMGQLAYHGYSRSVLVTKKRVEGHVRSDEEPPPYTRGNVAPPRQGRTSGGGRKIRYKRADE